MNMTASIKVVASTALDALLRLAVLEGAAGKAPGTWVGQGGTPQVAMGLEAAARALPDADPIWFTLKDTGTYKAVLRAAQGVVGEFAGEDVVQSILGGFSRSSGVKGGELYDVGHAQADYIAAGGQIRRPLSYLVRHTKQKAIDILRAQNRDSDRTTTLTSTSPEGNDKQIDMAHQTRSDSDLLSDLLQSSAGNAALRQVFKVWENYGRAEDINVVKTWLDGDPQTNMEWKSFRQLAKHLDISPMAVTNAIQRLVAVAQKKLPPEFYSTIEMGKHNQELGRMASLSTNVRLILRLIQLAKA